MRPIEALRHLELIQGVQLHAGGSCLVKQGNTHVLCAANLENKVPGWMKGRGTGWLTAELCSKRGEKRHFTLGFTIRSPAQSRRRPG